VKKKTTDNPTLNQDKPLLTCFLHELNISRRQLSLYPSDHPQIVASINRTIDILGDLFHSNQIITLGIAPDALYFEQLWLDKEDSTHREFARFFSKIGIASISFRQGLSGPELIRFNKLLTTDPRKTKSFGDFDQLFEQHQIEHITIVAIDYDAFQVNQDITGENQAAGEQLWENFLHGLHSGVLDFGGLDSGLTLSVIADIFNQKLVGNQTEREQSSRSVSLFIENSILAKPPSQLTAENDKKLAMLLEQLSPDAQQNFLNNTFRALEKHQEEAPDVLRKIPPHLLHNTITGKGQQSLNLSARMFGLINNLAASQDLSEQKNIRVTTAPLSEQKVLARLNILFSEEQQEEYLPDSYQSALNNILSDNITGTIPEAEKEKLKAQIEDSSAEKNCVAIIFELLQKQLDPEHEKAIEQNLLELSRFFLDVGDFISLRKIHANWSRYLDSNHSSASILGEKILSNHTQPTFMAEVLDSVNLWGEEKHQEIADYIVTVGEPYSESVIEYLGLAREWPERQFWMGILEGIGMDAQQMIIASLTDERWYLVRNLLIILGKNLDPQGLKVIHKLLNHPHPQVRIEVVRNLLPCNPATANRQLLQELNSPDPEAQLAAVQVADLSRDPNILSILHRKLGTPVDSDSELELKKQIIKTLTRIGHQESLPVLRRILQKQGLLVSRRIKELQVEILQNLITFPGTSTDKLLRELADSRYKQQAELVIKQRRAFLRRVQ
jgi:hypothetical protein